jgi:alanyl-tRNA synthetase
MELCGGTHLKGTGEVSLLTCIEEGSVAAGIRRIEALTGEGAVSYLKGGWAHLAEVAERLKAPPDRVDQAVERLIKQVKHLEEELQRLKVKEAESQALGLLTHTQRIGPLILLVEQRKDPMDHEALRAFVDAIRGAQPETTIFLCDPQGRCVSAAGAQARAKGVSAEQILRLAVQVAGGAGGGRADLAQGRLEQLDKFSAVREGIERYLKEKADEAHSSSR